MDDIQRIQVDDSNLDYEDYYNLVTFENNDNSYFCNLIIMDVKMGLKYSRYCDTYHVKVDDLSFEEWDPYLTTEITLMLGRKQ